MSRDSAAYKNGLEPGDIILSVNGTTIADPSQFVRLIADSSIGSTVRIEILRDGTPLDAPHSDRGPAGTPRPTALSRYAARPCSRTPAGSHRHSSASRRVAALALAALVAVAIALLVGSLIAPPAARDRGRALPHAADRARHGQGGSARHVRPEPAGARLPRSRSRRRRADRRTASRRSDAMADRERRAHPAADPAGVRRQSIRGVGDPQRRARDRRRRRPQDASSGASALHTRRRHVAAVLLDPDLERGRR